MKTLDYKQELRTLYRPGREPELVEVPELAFLMIDGKGDPNVAPAFADAIGSLYAVSYTAKFTAKRELGADYRVMPLEGLFETPAGTDFFTADRAEWTWTLMIMQPEPVTAELIEEARAKAGEKKPIGDLRFERFAEGLCAQVMHIGPYSAEGPTIERLHAFIAEQGHERRGRHHEIYLGDPRRSAPEKLKTIVRQPVG